MQGVVSPAACCEGRTLSVLVTAQAHTQFLNTSTPCIATWHVLYKSLIASKCGGYDKHECKWWKDGLMWTQGDVFSSQVSMGVDTNSCFPDPTNVRACADGCL